MAEAGTGQSPVQGRGRCTAEAGTWHWPAHVDFRLFLDSFGDFDELWPRELQIHVLSGSKCRQCPIDFW